MKILVALMAPPSRAMLDAPSLFVQVKALKQVLFSKITGPTVSDISTVGRLGFA